MTSRLLPCVGVALTLWLAPACLAHGDLDERIAALTRQIAVAPDAVELLLARGDLSRQHEDYVAALADYAAVRRLAPHTSDLDFRVARASLEAGAPIEALPPLVRHLAARPDDTRALLMRARTYEALAQWLPAADDYRRLLALLQQPTPGIFIARARTLLRAGAAYQDEAFAVFADGVDRCGPLVSLIHAAVDAAHERNRPELALEWLARLPPATGAQPQWQLRRAETLVAMRRWSEATASLQSARVSARALPPSRRATPAARALESRVESLLGELEEPR